MAFNFNDNPPGLSLVPPSVGPGAGATDAPAANTPPTPSPMSPVPAHLRPDSGTPATSDQSAAFVRFRSCRWQQPAENGNTEFCTHREVKPYAGTGGFDADAWCPDCQYYKLRRAPRKRESNNDYSY